MLTLDATANGNTGNITGLLSRASGSGKGLWAFGGASGDGVSGLGKGSGSAGVFGEGGSGAQPECAGMAVASGGHGVLGSAYSAGGLGGAFFGLRAQLSLVPAASAGTPAQQNYMGDIWVDSLG
jgi:hypothetical protein